MRKHTFELPARGGKSVPRVPKHALGLGLTCDRVPSQTRVEGLVIDLQAAAKSFPELRLILCVSGRVS